MKKYAVPSILLATLLMGCNDEGIPVRPSETSSGAESTDVTNEPMTWKKSMAFNSWVQTDGDKWIDTVLMDKSSRIAVSVYHPRRDGICQCYFEPPPDDFQTSGVLQGINYTTPGERASMINSEDLAPDSSVPLLCKFYRTDSLPDNPENGCGIRGNAYYFELVADELFLWDVKGNFTIYK